MINIYPKKMVAFGTLLFSVLFLSPVIGQKATNGIFLEKDNVQLQASLLGGNKFKKTAISFLTFGAIPSERIPFLLNASSNTNIKNQGFVFTFSTNVPLAEPEIFDRGFREAKSPKEFILIKLEKNERKDIRQIFRQKTNWQERIVAALIPFSSEQLEPGVFSVNPISNLETGEYCFVHQDILNTPIFSDFAFFDFSIAP